MTAPWGEQVIAECHGTNHEANANILRLGNQMVDILRDVVPQLEDEWAQADALSAGQQVLARCRGLLREIDH